MRRITLGGAAVAALLIAGCGTATRVDFKGHSRPAPAVDISVYINDQQVLLSPGSVGAGLVQFDITNQATRTELIAVLTHGGQIENSVAHTGELQPGGTAVISADLRSGKYGITGSGFNRHGNPAPIMGAILRVGAPRQVGDRALLQP